MRGLLATVLMLGGVLLLGACTEEQEAQDEPTATGTPAATAAATKTPTMTPAGAATSSTPSRGFVQRPTLPTPQPTATAAPAQTVVSQPPVVPQPTVVSQTTVVSQPTTVTQPTVVPTTTPPPTVVATVVPTPVHTPTPPPAATPMPTPTPPPPLPPTSIACPEPGSFSGIGQTTGGGDFGFDVVGGCGISRVWSYNEWAVCDDGTEANPDLVEIIYDQPLSIANGTFSDEGTECSAGPEGSWWCSTLRFAGQFTSDSMAKGGFDMQIEITGWAGADTVHCYLDDLNWRAFRE
jgi:hypothetical protein